MATLEEFMAREVYLGDGLYAAFDGHQVVLRAPRADGDHWVALEPGVLSSLFAYVKDLREAIQSHNDPIKKELN